MPGIVVRWLEDGALREGGVEALTDARKSKVVWVDVTDPDEASLAPVAEAFGLHPLAVEDCLHFPQRPKLDTYGDDAMFLIWVLPSTLRGDGLDVRELDVFLGEDHLVTVHAGSLEAIDEVAAEAASFLGSGLEWTLHAMLDRAVDAVFPVVDELTDRLEELEDLMLTGASKEHLQQLYAVKRLLLQLHKVVGPERDVLRGMARQQALISSDAYVYYQDIADHLARVQDSIDTSRDVASGAMDVYLSSVSNRLNVIMKQLTVIATIFMPLQLITGIYGMNFRHMPELAWRYGYFGVLGVMLVIALFMLRFFKRREWW
ncbi:MAG: magnesium/cobalt transporter CorA [Coriobacteriia bacterium]